MTVTTEPLVDTDWVAEHLEGVRVIEVDVAATAYRDGHVPGALLWNIYADLRRPDYGPISTAEIQGLLSRSGLTPETPAVFYGYGAHLGYWLLRAYGHERAFVLDGPREGWRDAGYDWTTDVPAPATTEYALTRPDPRLHASRESVASMIGKAGCVLVDVRSPAEHAGERFWPSGASEGAGRAGHIPGSVHVPIDLLRTPAGRFRSDGRLRHALTAAGIGPEDRVVAYCTVGNRAAQAWFALDRLGYRDAGVYPGSWAEWGLLPDTPVER